ncbi:hypothetical protein MNEG_4036 [Monoraphidium neglectum]|uniref:Uncharacterized protein n=1 Tax=Monoraphidium neglectum TaxID=145388 RepID=A0A0D2NFL5_9CHLO|nr:hypothetical protein MNEG_4036 [Monoraphidium neglectum]KIZ03921.1 hypothetical protein MNEG_4036 [Monoraphidium neglectum]|eukprot:XP_013902940.1 hypothetical protein MNEG_4036 [Monoraphidium neglectum]
MEQQSIPATQDRASEKQGQGVQPSASGAESAAARPGVSGFAAGAGAARADEAQPPSSDPAGSAPSAPGDVHRASLLAPERAAGGSAEEVAAANPGLAKALPAATGGAAVGRGEEAGGGGIARERGDQGVPLVLSDGSGMEVPELAVQAGWGEGV